TIGSASCGVLLTDRELSQTDNRLLVATARANTAHHRLCHSGHDEAVADGMQPLMTTDSERLMQEGIATGVDTFTAFLAECGWSPASLERTFCHQVGSAHRKLMLESLALDADNDFATLEWLGNTGSAALPTTLAIGLERGFVKAGDHVGMLGIGSGINCLMLAAQWQRAVVRGTLEAPRRSGANARPELEAAAT
ncbi:MAG: 3-oxoacyl-ACP synthase III, partial [Planctomycetales bacterium]|nr:3-oxoacyl-ACP synthase III [Planctomycetales bacterium]